MKTQQLSGQMSLLDLLPSDDTAIPERFQCLACGAVFYGLGDHQGTLAIGVHSTPGGFCSDQCFPIVRTYLYQQMSGAQR